MPAEGIDGVEVALGVEVGCSRGLEVAGDDLDLAIFRVDAYHLALEPERAIQPAVGSDFEAIEAAHVLGDQSGWLLAGAVDLPQGIAEKYLTGVERAGFVVEVQRVDAGQVARQDLDRSVVVVPIQHAAGVETSPGHLAVGADGDVVGLAVVRADQGAHAAVVDINLVDAVADHAAGKQAALLVDGQAVDALERGGGNDDFRA